MMHSATEVEIAEVDDTEFRVEPWSWEFAAAQRPAIDRYFSEMQRQRSHVWNGRVMLLRHYEIHGRMLRGSCFETDYASFVAWRDWNFPDPSAFNIFPVTALRGADGAFVVGEMAPWTAAAGVICFPGGTPDRDDLRTGGVLDIAASQRRELIEETGLDPDELNPEPGWTVVRERGFFGLLKRVRPQLTAEEIKARILRHLASDPNREFSEIRILREPADFDSRMFDYLRVYMQSEWQR